MPRLTSDDTRSVACLFSEGRRCNLFMWNSSPLRLELILPVFPMRIDVGQQLQFLNLTCNLQPLFLPLRTAVDQPERQRA